MTLFRKTFILSIFLMSLAQVIQAQELLVSPGFNPVRKNVTPGSGLKTAYQDTLSLPFLDDFSGPSTYPDGNLWTDSLVYINSNYPISSPSWKVATLDAMDSTGSIHAHATTKPFSADQLTSRPLDLFFPRDTTVYLSFYYQPQGLGDAPEPADSLLLEFYAPDFKTWSRVWSAGGSAVHEFRLVMINITDSRYLQKGFRFRFRNFASLAPSPEPSMKVNADQWHIDYVYLDRNRHYNETAINDLSLNESAGSLLINYTALPWQHFQKVGISAVKTIFSISMTNLSGSRRFYSPILKIESVYQPETGFEKTMSSDEVKAYETLKYDATFNYGFTSTERDSAVFRITLDLNQAEPDLIPANDKVETYQYFTDYYAYDDGTAEAGYGLAGEGTRTASLAYRFHNLYPGDSLVAIRFFFNRSFTDSNKKFFTLAIWEDDNNKPGNLIYTQDGGIPEFNGINAFQTIELDTAQVVGDTYYIGWIQTTTDFLNIGVDFHNNHINDILYNIYGNWQETQFEMALMMRPVFSNKSTKSSIDSPKSGDNQVKEVRFYPNPVNNSLALEYEEEYRDLQITVFDLQGRVLIQESKRVNTLDTSLLSDGLYFIRINCGQRIILQEKLVVLHE